jgi:hypothetical protein
MDLLPINPADRGFVDHRTVVVVLVVPLERFALFDAILCARRVRGVRGFLLRCFLPSQQ